MDDIYDDLKSRTIKLREDDSKEEVTSSYCKSTSMFARKRCSLLRALLEDYEVQTSPPMKYNYRTRQMFFTTFSGSADELSFACVTKFSENPIFYVYYISGSYNMNTQSNDPTDQRMSAHFLCLASSFSNCTVVAMAEKVASAFGTAQYLIEDIYLRLRSFFHPGECKI